VLQGKLRRAERMLKQREIRIAELQSRCRRFEKEDHKKADKTPQPHQHQQQQPRVQSDDNKDA